MSALDDIRRALTDAYGTGIVLRDETADDLIKAAVAEFDMDAQAYPGELAMLRGLVRTLRVVVRPDDAHMDEVRRLLWEHAHDEAAAITKGKSSPAGADATPELHGRLAQLLDTIRTHRGEWRASRVQELRRITGGPTQRGIARRDLADLHRMGHLKAHGPADGRFYTLNTRKDGRL